jgi:hypothetical protein
VWLTIAFVASLAAPALAQDGARAEIRPVRATAPPKVDGILDDQIWSGDPIPAEQWVSYNPLRGEPGQQRTQVWMGYDAEAIYFAFKCFDPEPDKIRTTITRRDNAFADDWVAISLDSSRAGQVAYHMFVNPSGIQMDALNTASGEDTAPDWTWQSAGRITTDGYTVEVRVPLESIRFSGGEDVRMGVMFFRRNSRLGLSWSWPEMPPGTWVFETHVPVVFDRLDQPLLLEVIPSATFANNQTRAASGGWNAAASKGDFGASVKYGVSSTITLDATVNPDFSQVESDAFQVEVNQRFPTFFSEKRPFFMEGLGLFNLAGTGGDQTMRTAVHTRRIIEPSVGVKLTGTAGRQTFAVLSAADGSTPGARQQFFTIGRAMRNFGQGQYLGALVTNTEYRGAHNRVAAVDASVRHGERFRWKGSALYSTSRALDGTTTDGFGAQGEYGYSTRRVTIAGALEHFDRGFQMDTAFINRVGLTRGWQYGELQFYPAEQSRYGWIKRVAPFVWGVMAKDRVQNGTEPFALGGVRFNFTRQGNLRVDVGRGRETFAGQRFVIGRTHVDGGAQITRWLRVGGAYQRGPGIFYDAANAFGGISTYRNLGINWQPNSKLSHNIGYTLVTFDRPTGERVYDVHVVNLRNTYQFTPQFLMRAIAQYDSSRRRVLGDFLASYELSPGTVVHAGYGSLLESQPGEPYSATARAFFFKASYLARF